jgi:hypothetical protein
MSGESRRRTNIESSEAGDVPGDKDMALQWIPQGIDIGAGPTHSHVTGSERRKHDALATAGVIHGNDGNGL